LRDDLIRKNTVESKYDIVAGFNKIASGYDLANDAMTFGMHRMWRNSLVKRATRLCPRNGLILDLATGTGDVAIGIAKQRKDATIIALDPAEEMLKIARSKALVLDIDQEKIDFKIGDAKSITFPDNHFDLVTISWGIRNVIPFVDGLKEILRVLKPGGVLLVLESGKPEYKPIGKIYSVYAKVVPYIGGGISGYKEAYNYYIRSADSFLSGKEFTSALESVGYVDCNYKTLGMGLIFIYQAQKTKN
jgi:demethylmenaquinone methyltransferase / 2-methoxy-6-polyprenyl-1,4-benzoquinol methylase